MSFIHLHVYSAYSLLTSTVSVEQLVARAKQKGFSAIALTDRNVMYGTVQFYKECLKHSIKPIIGLCADIESAGGEKGPSPLVLLAQNQDGFQNLLKISSTLQTKADGGIPVKWLKHYSSGLIALTPGLEGEIEQYIAGGEEEKALEAIRLYTEIFGKDRFYLAYQDHGLPEEKKINRKLKELSVNHGFQTAAANQVFYAEKEDAFAQECLLAIKNGDKLQDENRFRLQSDEYYLKTAEEMSEVFTESTEALENTIKIMEQCNVMLELDKKHLPKYPVPEGDADTLLEELCWKGFAERYPEASEVHRQRLLYELGIIKKMKFSDYFLIVWDFIKFSRENGILTGPGRGSAAGSMVSYVLYITDADPIEHELLFERFLNPERISMPDIDIDFPDHRRDEVIRYVAKKYGELHVAQIITFGTLAAKAAMRDTGRVFGLNTKELEQVSRLIPSRPGTNLKTAYKESEQLRAFTAESSLNKRLFETALKIEGLPRHTSTHAAGVVISEFPLVNVVPIQQGHEGVYLTQYSMEHLEAAGLLKMDFLGLRNLSLIETILSSIQRKTGKKPDIKKIPLDDEKTYRLLSSGETTGVFQLESDGMRNVLKKLKPTRFEDIVAVNALYRPGPMENIPSFINRKHGKEPISYPHPDLKPYLEKTYGVIVYQEQIMQIASKMAGFSLGEADLLRRAVSKKQKDVLDRERAHFASGAVSSGYDEKTAQEVYDLIVRFANYGFNRSHAVAYSFIAYQLAYLKANYPFNFMAALLSQASGNEDKLAQYIRELKHLGLTLLPPSINSSGYSFQAESGGIRYSLAAVKGIGASVLKDVFHARRQKRFEDLFDFCIRVPAKSATRKILEAFVHSGSFDEFGEDRAVLLATLDIAIEHAELVKPDESGQEDFFSEDEFSIKPKYAENDPIRIEDKLQYEKEYLGLYLSDHPVSVYAASFASLGVTQLADMEPGSRNIRTAAYLSEVKKIRTKKGEAMAFLSLNDQSGEMEAVVFPAVYKRDSALLKQGAILLLEGKAEERDGKRQFIVNRAADMGQAAAEAGKHERTLYLKVPEDIETPEGLKELKAILGRNPGSVPVVLHYAGSQKTIRLAEGNGADASEKLLKDLGSVLGTENVIIK
ncbi:DNA polymerase III subunit alpha [Bacillus infantis]|uniref:DNA polymerase III subunit alpha n=1 Tax=Bacillus infantis TaxID=324767 RepID=UPI00101BAE40|nr:DNA polymerase III subunit alpha [Bacillus infantis]RYI26186.1 DNA polymerase III subunit alpha [Bacillus infantis]